MYRTLAAFLLAAAVLPARAAGGDQTYHFGAAQARTNITFESKADLETIVGTSQLITGSATVNWEAGSAKIDLSVPVASLRTGIDMRDDHLRGEMWLDAAKFPAIQFASESAMRKADSSTWALHGPFTLHGVAKAITIEVDVKQVPAEAAKKANLGAGDWVRVRSSFDVKLSDHGVKVPEMAAAKVQDSWRVTIDLFGTTEKPKEAKPMPESEVAKGVKAPEVKVEGAGTRFRFGLFPQLTNIAAESVTDLETVIASTSTASGAVVLDTAKGSATVKIAVPVASLRTGIEMRDEHLRSAHWLDAEKHPEIVFEAKQASRGSDGSWTVEGTFSLHGQAKPLTAVIAVRELPADAVKKAGWGSGAGLKVRTTFTVKLSDFGVKVPDIAAAKVKDEWTVTFDAVAISE